MYLVTLKLMKQNPQNRIGKLKNTKKKVRESRLDGVPVALPSLVRAQRLQEKASYVGFEWDKIEEVWEKVHEEIIRVKGSTIRWNTLNILKKK